MSASTVALATPRHGGSLALLLAALGVPGVTIAWDLPAGGFWIGIPLAIAAVVVGVRARGTRPRLATAAIVLAAMSSAHASGSSPLARKRGGDSAATFTTVSGRRLPARS